jgi:RimJ/RimL family protein N-acetyltransferase
MKILNDGTIRKRSILLDGEVVGYLASFQRFGKPEVSYWIDRKHWGKGIATKALSEFLLEVKTRPIYARAAKDNVGSVRVLEKCGFKLVRVLEKCGFKLAAQDKGFANARGAEVEELIFEMF